MRRIGGYMAGMGTFVLATMGCCLDSAAWKVVLVLVVISLVMIAVGIRMMKVPEVLKEKGLRYESKVARDQKSKNREETFATWRTTW